MTQRHGIAAFLLTGLLGGHIPGAALAMEFASSGPWPRPTVAPPALPTRSQPVLQSNVQTVLPSVLHTDPLNAQVDLQIDAQTAPQTAPVWQLAQAAQPTLADADRLYEEANQRYQAGDYEAALNRVEAALRVLEQVLPSENPNIPRAFEQVAQVLSQLDRHDDATTYYALANLMSEAGRGIPLNPESIERLPQTLTNSVTGQLDERSLRADQMGYLELTNPLLSSVPLAQLPQLPLTGAM